MENHSRELLQAREVVLMSSVQSWSDSTSLGGGHADPIGMIIDPVGSAGLGTALPAGRSAQFAESSFAAARGGATRVVGRRPAGGAAAAGRAGDEPARGHADRVLEARGR